MRDKCSKCGQELPWVPLAKPGQYVYDKILDRLLKVVTATEYRRYHRTRAPTSEVAAFYRLSSGFICWTRIQDEYPLATEDQIKRLEGKPDEW